MRTWMAVRAEDDLIVRRRDDHLQREASCPVWPDVATRTDLRGRVHGDRRRRRPLGKVSLVGDEVHDADDRVVQRAEISVIGIGRTRPRRG